MSNPEPKPATHVIRRVVDQPGGTSVLYWLHNPNPSLTGRWVPQSSRATRYQPGSDIRVALSEIPRDEAMGARVVRLKPKATPQPDPGPARPASADAVLQFVDETISLESLRFFATRLVRLQRPVTASDCVVGVDDGVPTRPSRHVFTFATMGLINVYRKTWVTKKAKVEDPMLHFCLTEEGRIYAERFRPVWDALGIWQANADGERARMPWPGLPEPYQPGTIAPTF